MVSSAALGLEQHKLFDIRKIHWNLSSVELYEHAIQRGEGQIALHGPIVVNTAPHTGRSPLDRFIVHEDSSADKVSWGKINQAMTPDQFAKLHTRFSDYLRGKDLFVQDLFVGADPAHKMPIRVISELAWHNLFARYMFIRPTPAELATHKPQFTVITVPSFKADSIIDGTRKDSTTVIAVNLADRLVLIGGSSYAGETKKSIFSIQNYLLPIKGVLSMHCSANYGQAGDAALFFGLSGTGKTTLSADPERTLIGDDEHGWSDTGVFNFEGGCYAKVIKLSREAEPEIFATTETFGAVLENVVMDPLTRALNLDDETITENTRSTYPIDWIPNATLDGRGAHPQNIFFLAADAYGVLPPISRLNPDQAMYHFLSGYTAKVAGTEKGLKQPESTFSTCFGAPFMVLHPRVYAQMLGEKIAKHHAKVWLVNTGWSGGAYGVGARMKLQYTRALLRAALTGALDNVPATTDPTFGFQVPTQCPEVPPEVLIPRNTWADKAAYDAQAKKLAGEFVKNFEQFAGDVPASVVKAGPSAG
ncbi:MAG: phosphoenolpyruvate carboxykinase [Chloroflexi bacterium]|nr:phosphoenolpyruvate carboxykinase [Chloroflexota bacterium]